MIMLLASLAFACPSLDAENERAAAALVAGDFAGAHTAIEAARNSFACAAANREQIGRFWLAEGAAAHLRADTKGAHASLAAARAIGPSLYDNRLGTDIRATWSSAEPLGAGTLLLEPRRSALVDGAEVTTWPLTLSSGPHVVQVIGADGKVRYGRLVEIGPGEDALVETGLGPEPEVVAATGATTSGAAGFGSAHVLTEPKQKKSPAMLILAGVAAAGAGAFAGGALAQNAQIDTAADIETLDSAFGRQKAFGYTSYGLMGAAAAVLTLHFVIE